MTGIPAEVITAAAKLLSAHYFDLKDGKPDAEEVWMATQMLEAAAPLIAAQAAATEREAIHRIIDAHGREDCPDGECCQDELLGKLLARES